MADPKPAQNRVIQGQQSQTRVAPAPVNASVPEEPEVVESSVDPMEVRLAEMEAKFEARTKAMDEEMQNVIKRIKEEAQARVITAEAAARAKIEEAQRIIVEATSPGAAKTPKVSASSKEDIAVLVLRTQNIVRAGGRTYNFVKDEDIMMDPSHAAEYEQSGWVKRLKARKH